MNVEQLIEQLQKLPKDAEVWNVWDGAARWGTGVAYLSRAGKVLIAPEREPMYYQDDWPADSDVLASGEVEQGNWYTTPEKV